nr:achaete-scute homolog 3 [Pogona vitticeps]
MEDKMAKTSFCNAMDSLPVFSDSHVGQMSKFCSIDPFATFHSCPDALNQFAGLEDLPLVPFTAEPVTAEHFYDNPYSFLFQAPCGRYEYSCSPAFIRKRNERERQRVKCVNEGYAKLRHHLPAEFLEKRLSKVETLRAAIKYIKYLQFVLSEDDSREAHKSSQYGTQNDQVPMTS